MALPIESRFRIALGLIAVLVAMVWLTMEPTKLDVANRQIDMRWLPTLVLMLFAAKMYIHRQAEKLKAEERERG